MSRSGKSSPSPSNSHARVSAKRLRPSAQRSDFLFPPASLSSSSDPVPAPASLGGQSRLSIRPFDVRESDNEEQLPASSNDLNGRRRSNIYQVSCAPHLHPTPDDPGYSVSGYGTSGFTYHTRERKRTPEVLAEEDRKRWKEVAPEDALRALSLDYAHSLRVKVKSTTRTALATAMRRETGEVDRGVLKLCETGQLSSKCGVYQILDSNTAPSDHQYTIVTRHAMKQYEPVIAVIGTLRERDSYEAWVGGHRAIAMLHAIDIDPAEMPPSYNGPDLLLDTAHYTNEVRFLRDPRFSHRAVEANVEARLVWQKTAGLPYVVFVTLQAMPAGVELWKRWDVQSREVAWRVQMKYAAKRSHCQHRYIGILQDEMRQRGLPPVPPSLLKRREAADGDGEQKEPAVGREYVPFVWRQSESWTLHHVCAHAIQEATTRENRRLREKLRMLRKMKKGDPPTVVPTLAVSMQRQEDEARRPPYDFELLEDESVAYAASECKQIAQNDWSGIGGEVMMRVQVKYKQHEREAMRLMEDVKAAQRTGVLQKAAIHRVISLHHPARFYAPPCHPSFALVATQPMKRSACIGAYIGRVRTVADYNASANPFSAVYTYNLDPLGLDLVIDSQHAGNALRYMNDCFARRGGARTANAQPRYLFDADTKRPNCFILCTAQQGIRKGEEIVTDYGRAYWSRICRALLSEHGRYGDQARVLIEALVSELNARGLEVPKAKEWREVRDVEFRDDWVVWPEFGRGVDDEEESDWEDDEREMESWKDEEEDKRETETSSLAVKVGPEQSQEDGNGRVNRKRPVRKRRREPPWETNKKKRASAVIKQEMKDEEDDAAEEEEEQKEDEDEDVMRDGRKQGERVEVDQLGLNDEAVEKNGSNSAEVIVLGHDDEDEIKQRALGMNGADHRRKNHQRADDGDEEEGQGENGDDDDAVDH